MKKLTNLIALVMLVSINVLTPFSYAQDVLPEVIPENEVENVEEDGEIPEISEETPDLDPEEKGEIEQEKQEDETAEKVLSDVQDDIETPVTDETEKEDTVSNEGDEIVQSMEEISEVEVQDENLEGGEAEDDFSLQKVDEFIMMEVIPNTSVTLLPGTGFNETIKRLAGGSGATYNSGNSTITQIVQTGNIPEGVITGEISEPDSEYPVYAYFTGGILYYTTQAETIYMNPDSSFMFARMSGITRLNLNNLNTENVINMSFMFRSNDVINVDISEWDTSNVRNMSFMFYYCDNISRLDLNSWDVSSVTTMESMFNGCSSLTGLDLSNWDTSSLTKIPLLFWGCNSLEYVDLSNWTTSNLTQMNNAFTSCNNLIYLNMSGWDFSSMNSMVNWINVSNLRHPLDKLDLTNAKFSGNLSYIFGSSQAKEIKLDGVDTSNATNMSYMFDGCKNLTELNLSSFDTSNVIDMVGIFNWSSVKDVNMSGRDFAMAQSNNKYQAFQSASSLEKINLTNAEFSGSMGSFFQNLTNLGEIEGIEDRNTSNVTDMNHMFYRCSSLTGLLDLSNWNTNKVTNMDYMFYDNNGLQELNLSGWDISNVVSSWTNFFGKALTDLSLKKIDVTNMKLSGNISYFFKGLTNLEQIKGLDTWDTSNVTNIGSIFQGCSSLTGLVDLSTWNVSNVNDMGGMFKGCNKIDGLNLSGWDFRNLNSDASLMVSIMGGTTQYLKKLNMTNTKYTGNATYAFGGLNKLEELNLNGADTSNVTSMNAMFNGDSNLKKLDLSNFDISNVNDMGGMFGGCSKLEEINLSGWDFRSYSNASLMMNMTAGGIPSLTKLNMTNTKYTGNATYAFGGLNKLEELNLNGADTSNVTSMNAMFNGDSNLKILDLGGLDTSNVKDMSAMFYNCSSLEKLTLSSFDTSNVTSMGAMFYGCSSLNELDLSNFDTSKVTTLGQMFYNTPNLKTIYASENFVTTALSGDTSSKDMFSGTISVVGGNGTKFDPNYIDEEYAKIDKVGQTGYFTDKFLITVKFINTLDSAETLLTFAKGQKLTPPSVNGYHVVGGYLDEAMTQKIDLNKGVDSYSEIYVKYERNGSSGGGGGGGGGATKPDTPKEEQKPADTLEQISQNDNSASSGANVKIPENETQMDSQPSEQSSVEQPEGQGNGRSNTSDNSYTNEQKEAYEFAKENGITTKDTIQSAQMNGKLTRIAMAKMLSQYAINVLGQTPDTSKTVKFKDVSNKKDADYDNGVTLAYQLGIMGQNMPGNKFRPNDEVSRAEFATALSRLLYQTTDGEYKSTKEYYIPHMAKLYNEGIISNTDPSMAERRGYVMIMLMRSAK